VEKSDYKSIKRLLVSHSSRKIQINSPFGSVSRINELLLFPGWLILVSKGGEVMTVLITGQDLGFSFWLGRALDERGYSSFPAKDASAAMTLIRDLNLTVDLLIVHAELPGASSLVRHIKELGSRVKVIFVEQERGMETLSVEGFVHTPIPSSQSQRLELLDLIEGLLGRAAVEI